MEIRKIDYNKKKYLNVLLLADEQESMVDRYLERGDLYVLYDEGVVKASLCCDTKRGRSSGIEKIWRCVLQWSAKWIWQKNDRVSL